MNAGTSLVDVLPSINYVGFVGQFTIDSNARCIEIDIMQDSRNIATLIGMARNARLKLHSESCSSSMTFRSFLSGIARNETTALAFLRDKEVFEKQEFVIMRFVEGKCMKEIEAVQSRRSDGDVLRRNVMVHTQGVERQWAEVRVWCRRSRGNRLLL